MASGSMSSKSKRVLPETNTMEYFPTDPEELACLLTGFNSSNTINNLTAISQTQQRFGKYQQSQQIILDCENDVPVLSRNGNFLFSKQNSPVVVGGEKIHYSNVADNQAYSPHYQEVYDFGHTSMHIEELLPEDFEDSFSGITLDPEMSKDPERIHTIDQRELAMAAIAEKDVELIGEVLVQNAPNHLLPEGMNVSNYIASGNPNPTQVDHADAQLDLNQNFIIVDDTVTIVNHPELQNARVLAVIPSQSNGMTDPVVYHEMTQLVGCQQIPTVVEVINMDEIQQIKQINAAEIPVPRRKPGRPRKDSYQALSKKMESQPTFEPVPSVSGERSSKLKCKKNIKTIVNDINTEHPEVDEYLPLAGRKRKLSTSSTASTSSSSSTENKNPNNIKNNMASKKSRDKKKEQEKQKEEELMTLQIVNDQLKRQKEELESAISRVQAEVFKLLNGSASNSKS